MINAPARRRSRAGAWILAAAGAFLASWYAGGAAAPDRPAGPPRAACWLVVDMDSFFCGACLDHVLAFVRAVPAGLQADRVRAILAFGPSRTPEDARRRAAIVRAKWQGFSRAHGLVFPASVDADGAFAGLAKSGAAVLVFDERAGALRRFSLPVPTRALEDVIRILLD